MLIEIAKQQLKKAGWYEGRKIDLTKYEEAYAKIGCELFPAARKFLEEFGDLAICDKVEFPYTKDGVSYNESSTQWSICAGRRDLELEKRVNELYGQKILRVGALDYCEIYIYIFQKMDDSLLIGIVLVFGQKIQISFGMSTMVKTMVGQLGMI